MTEAFRPRFPWLGADLQTLRNFFGGPGPRLPASESVELAMSDGDRLLAEIDRPPGRAMRPAVVLIHGLTGCSTSAYVRQTAAALLDAGHAVVRLNLRGAGPGRRLARGQYHAGRSADLLDAFTALPPALAREGLLAVGFSLGGNLLLKHLGEAGRDTVLRAAASVSAPIDLAATSKRLMAPRNALYHAYLLRRMKAEATAPGATVSDAEREAIREAGSVLEYDDRFVAPRNGFAGAADYYAKSSAAGFLATIRTPTLAIHALDDPWIPGALYERVDWGGCPCVTPLLSRAGGHVGFHGAGDPVPWYARRILAFFASAG